MNGRTCDIRTDVAVVGAGSSGSAAALQCARRGMEVICIDRRKLERAGARWANNIPGWTFEAAGVARPTPPELVGEEVPLHMFAGFGPRRIVIENAGLLEVDMRRLVGRLQSSAEAAGARFMGEVSVGEFDGEVLETSKGSIGARWFVDAAGLGGAGLIDTPTPERSDICTAAQQAHRITDAAAARRFFADRDVPYGHILCYAGTHGSYSVIFVRPHGDDQINILTGSIPANGNSSGRQILAEFVDANSDWIGAEIFGGSSPIPLGPPARRLARGRVAVIGDAALQVLSAHGSGVGAGLVAANMLAKSLAEGAGAAEYARRWQRRYGALFAAYEMFRRFSVELSADELAKMMEHGLLHPELASLSLRQTVPIPDRLLFLNPLVLFRAPRLTLKLGSAAVDMVRAALLYRSYPDEAHRIPQWSKKARRLFDDAE